MSLIDRTFAGIRTVLAALVVGGLALAAQATTTDIYYHNDLAGTPLAATDGSGNVLWRQSYKPYGERLNPKAPAEQLPWYTGKAHVEAAGLSYYGARWYDPVLGRFMGVDPAGFSEANLHSFNRYAYANNNPYKFVDPDGRSPLMLLGRFFGGGAFGAGLGTVADAISQKAAFGSVDWAMAAQSSAGREGAIAGAMSFLPGDTPAGLSIKAARESASAIESSAIRGAAREAPDFVVSPGGTAFPVPKGSTGPVPVMNESSLQTGTAFVGGSGGANSQVTTMRMMDPAAARGTSPGYPGGYIKYENRARQGVDPYSGRTLPNSQSHFPID